MPGGNRNRDNDQAVDNDNGGRDTGGSWWRGALAERSHSAVQPRLQPYERPSLDLDFDLFSNFVSRTVS